MNKIFQRTIAREGSLVGIGVHTGEKAAVYFKPAPANTGLVFQKFGKILPDYSLHSNEEGLRCSSVGEGEGKILTVEHLLAALSGLGICNLCIDVHGPEIPVMDGSSKEFVDLFKQAGIQEQNAEQRVFKVEEPIFCYEDTKAIAAYPDDKLRVAYVMDYEHPALGTQAGEWAIDEQAFIQEIAPARTFCTEEEMEILKQSGMGKGGNFQNTLVYSSKGVIDNTLRFPDESLRHKVLDILGDLALTGFPIQAKIVAIRSGHSLNRKLVNLIKEKRAHDRDEY